MRLQLETGDRVGFAPAWLRRQRERWVPLTGREFPLNSSHQGRVQWVQADSCLHPRPRTRVQVVWTDGENRWANVLPISALRRLKP